MFTLEFHKSKSTYYLRALKEAEKMNAVIQGDKVRVELTQMEILKHHQELGWLVDIVHKWKGTISTLNGQEIDPYRFLFVQYDKIGDCAYRKKKTANTRHCQIDNDSKGWGCRLLKPFQREVNLREYGEYMVSVRYWYNFGELVDGVWHVNKLYILEMLQQSVHDLNLELCPHFDMSRIIDAVGSLPDTIQIDNVNYRLFKHEGYASNIRHCSTHFCYKDKAVYKSNTHYSDICALNYLSFIEVTNSLAEISRN